MPSDGMIYSRLLRVKDFCLHNPHPTEAISLLFALSRSLPSSYHRLAVNDKDKDIVD